MNYLLHKEWQKQRENEGEENSSHNSIGEFYLEAVRQYLPVPINAGDLIRFEPAKGSVNNIIRFVYLEPHDTKPQYLLRIYNNGNDFQKIQFEHLILRKLESLPKNFEVPRAIRSLETQETIIKLSNGSYASLFHIIDGVLPGLELTYEIGEACGQLSLLFSHITTNLSVKEKELISTKPYYDLYGVHETITRDIFLEEVASTKYDTCRDDMTFLLNKVFVLEANLQKYHDFQLPMQLIHGDLHYDNILVHFAPIECSSSPGYPAQGSRVTGILDFEFCAIDWKAMELAICLSKYLAQADPLRYIAPFIQGYAQGSGRLWSREMGPLSPTSSPYLTQLECTVLPSLIELRILSNVVFFVARVRAQQESVSILTGGKAGDYRRRLDWIDENRERLVSLLLESFQCHVLPGKEG